MPLGVTVTVFGDSLPAFGGDSASDEAVGWLLRISPGKASLGRRSPSSTTAARRVVLILAHWCPHFQREVPVLQSYSEETGFPETVDIDSVATIYSPTQTNWPPSSWLARGMDLSCARRRPGEHRLPGLRARWLSVPRPHQLQRPARPEDERRTRSGGSGRPPRPTCRSLRSGTAC